MNNLTLQIDPLDDHEGWRAEWYLGEKVIGQPIPIDGDAARALLDENRRLSELFEQRRRPLTEPGYLYALGRMMFEHWFQPVWETVAAQLGTGPRSLLIRSNVAAGPRTGRNVAAGPRTGRGYELFTDGVPLLLSSAQATAGQKKTLLKSLLLPTFSELHVAAGPRTGRGNVGNVTR